MATYKPAERASLPNLNPVITLERSQNLRLSASFSIRYVMPVTTARHACHLFLEVARRQGGYRLTAWLPKQGRIAELPTLTN